MTEEYKVYAVKYAHHARKASENFIGGDSHDGPMPLDYFVWAIVGETHSFIVDTGFDQAEAAKRGRTITRPAGEGLKAIGIAPDSVSDVVVTHMHYDHAGNHDLFPNATYHLQDSEMAYCTGRCMCHPALSQPFAVDDVTAMVRRVFDGRVRFHDGASELAPGVSVHALGGHTAGLQVVRVRTRRGWMVLASDASHFYANMDQGRPFPIVYNVADMLEGHRTVKALAGPDGDVIPGHDPMVLDRYPAAASGLEGWVVRLDGEK